MSCCERLAISPHRGTARADIRSEVIAFAVDNGVLLVSILGVFYGGQDYETAPSEPEN